MAGKLPMALHRLAVADHEVEMHIARRLGLGESEYLALKHVMLSPQPMGPSELGRLLGMSSGAATGLVDRLATSGHVVRLPHPQDRRRQVLHVTVRTQQDLTRELQPVADTVETIAREFTADERVVICRFLDLVAESHLRRAAG